MSICLSWSDSAIDSDPEFYADLEWDPDWELPPPMDLIRSYYISTIKNLAMTDPRDEPLTSFAENPTRGVEMDALVESQPQFTRPDQVESTTVEEAKWWPWTKGKKNENFCNMSRKFMIGAYCALCGIGFILAAVCLIWLLNTLKTPVVHEPETYYTLATVDFEKENQKAAHARLILPEAIRKASSEGIETTLGSSTQFPIEEITETEVEELQLESDHHGDDHQLDDIHDDIHEIHEDEHEKEEIDATEITHATEDTTLEHSYEATTSKVLTSTSLQFHNSVHGNEPEGCLERHSVGSPTGIYTTSHDLGYKSYCDMDTTSGGWTIIQRRIDGDGSFHRGTMKDYERGFGDLKGSHWLGLDQIHHIAPIDGPPAILRIEIQGETCDTTCSKRYANTWSGEWKITVGPKEDGYKLQIFGEGVGNLTYKGVDPLNKSDGMRFTTVDKDLDENGFINCAQFRMVGPWWHPKTCSDVGLNGYLQTTSEKYDIKDKNQNAKRYFVWAFDKKTYNDYPYIIHVRKSTIFLKPDSDTLDFVV